MAAALMRRVKGWQGAGESERRSEKCGLRVQGGTDALLNKPSARGRLMHCGRLRSIRLWQEAITCACTNWPPQCLRACHERDRDNMILPWYQCAGYNISDTAMGLLNNFVFVRLRPHVPEPVSGLSQTSTLFVLPFVFLEPHVWPDYHACHDSNLSCLFAFNLCFK